jgi:hypothetical protein
LTPLRAELVGAAVQKNGLLALRSDGEVDVVDPTTGQAAVLARGAMPTGGIAESLSLRTVYVTAAGKDGRPAVWSIPLVAGAGSAHELIAGAELPALSPDGGYLAYVTLDQASQQDGVAITALSAAGTPVGAPRELPATSVPPPQPITELALGRRDAELAVVGGAVDDFLGPHQPTVGTLDPSTATSLALLVLGDDGSQMPNCGGCFLNGGTWHPKKNWQLAPIYTPDGYRIEWDNTGDVYLPYEINDSFENSGGDRTLVEDAGSVKWLAYGPDWSLALVTANGRLEVAPRAAYLPFGPTAEAPDEGPLPAPAVRLGTGYEAVAWTPAPTAERTPLPAPWPVSPMSLTSWA